jgi:hypothetical protein
VFAAALVAVVAFVGVVPARPAARQAPLPSGADLAARHVKALGGAEAWKRISSVRMDGTIEMPGQGISGTVVVMAARPSSMLLRVNVSGIGTIESAYNGTHGWQLNPMAGPSLLQGRELDETRDDAYFDGTLYGADYVKSMTVVGQEDFDSRKAYKAQIVLASGREQTEYFDAESGLQIGSESRRATEIGVVPTISILRGFKRFGDVVQPTELIQRAFGIEQVIRISNVTFNDVPASAFEPPAEIKALIKAPGR